MWRIPGGSLLGPQWSVASAVVCGWRQCPPTTIPAAARCRRGAALAPATHPHPPSPLPPPSQPAPRQVPDVTREDFARVMGKATSSVATRELAKYTEWTKEFGSDGS